MSEDAATVGQLREFQSQILDLFSRMDARFSAMEERVEAQFSTISGQFTEVKTENDRRKSVLEVPLGGPLGGKYALGTEGLYTPERKPLSGEDVTTEQIKQVVYAESKIDDSAKMKKINAKNYLAVLREQNTHNSKTKDPQGLSSFLSNDCITALYIHEKNLNDDLRESLQVYDYAKFTDARLKLAIARHPNVRVQDSDDFGRKLWATCRELRADKMWTFGTKGYHRKLAPQVTQIVEDIKGFWELAVYNATPNELARLPKAGYHAGEYGKDLANYFMATLRPFEKEFEKLLEIGKLKDCKDGVAFAKLLGDENARMSKEAERLDTGELRFKLATPVTQLLKVVAEETQQYRVRVGKQYNQNLSALETTLSPITPAPADTTLDQIGNEWFLGFDGNPQVKRPDRGTPQFTAKPKERTLPCYACARTGKCDVLPPAQCPYSHDPEVLRGHIHKLFETYLPSPYIPDAARSQLKLVMGSLKQRRLLSFETFNQLGEDQLLTRSQDGDDELDPATLAVDVEAAPPDAK